MIGTPASLTVRVSRKLGDKDFGSYGVEAEITVNLPADAPLNEAFDAADSWLTAAVARSIQDKTEEVQKGRKDIATTLQESADASNEIVGKIVAKAEGGKTEYVPGEEHSEKVVKFTLAKRTDGKFELGLYGDYGGKPSQYPILRHVREREAMWEMLKPVLEDFDFGSLPVEHPCELLAHYVISDRKTPKGHFYKDLLALKGM